MADISLSDIKRILRAEFGETVPGSRDDGLDRMTEVVASELSGDRASAEAALALMVENGTLRYVTEQAGGTGAGIIGALSAPSAADINPMEGGKPLHGAVAASQEHGDGYWDLGAD